MPHVHTHLQRVGVAAKPAHRRGVAGKDAPVQAHREQPWAKRVAVVEDEGDALEPWARGGAASWISVQPRLLAAGRYPLVDQNTEHHAPIEKGGSTVDNVDQRLQVV